MTEHQIPNRAEREALNAALPQAFRSSGERVNDLCVASPDRSGARVPP